MSSKIENMQADWTSHHIEGIARHGNTPFRAPLISHIAGNLWSGGCIQGVRLPDEFRFVLSLYPWERFEVGPGTEVLEVKMYDAGHLPDLEDLYSALTRLNSFVEQGQTLVHCQAGLNRSGLLAALHLIGKGRSPKDAIALLREKRSPAVLCNPHFNNWLMAGAVEWLRAWEERGDEVRSL